MRRITYFFVLFATLFMAVGTQTASADCMVMDTGKWYRIKSAAQNRVLTACDDNGAIVTGQGVTDGSGLCYGNQEDTDGQLFRFVVYGYSNSGGQPYAIQNKATGLYISTEGKLTKAPGQCLIEENNDPEHSVHFTFGMKGEEIDDATAGFLAKSSTGNITVGWNTADYKYCIEEVADVAEDYKPAPLVVSDEPGKISFQCWPVELSCQNGMFKAVYIKLSETASPALALKKITTANAGEPFVYIHGTGQVWKNAEKVDANIQIGNDITRFPQQANGMIGVFKDTPLNRIYCVTEWGIVQADATVHAFNAYLDVELPYQEVDGDYDLIIGMYTVTPIPTAIDKTLQKVGKAGNVYDMSGRQVATGATLDDVQRLPSGTYIFNGIKVGVK